MGSFNQVFGGGTIYPSDATYLAITMATDVTLAWPIEQQLGGNIVADIIDVDASVAGLFINIPDSQEVSTGYTALFNNVGSETVTIRDFAGGTIISVAPGTCWQIYLRDNSTAAGLWRTFQYGASVSVAVASALAGAGLKAITTTLNFALPVTSTATTPTTLIASDRAKFYNWTGGVGVINLPDPAVVGNDWNLILRNSGSGNWTVTPSVGTIDGSATKTLAPGESCLVVTDGSNFYTLSGGGGSGGGGFSYLAINVAGAGDYPLSGAELNQIGYSFTGILTGTRNIVVPGTTQEYWVSNDTTGAFSLFVKTAAQSPGVEVLQNNKKILYCNGTNVVPAESASVSFPIPVAQGGTGGITAAAARTNLGVPPDTRSITAGTGLTGGGNLTSDRTIALSHLGIQNLSDPNADRIMFWDDSAGATAWLTPNLGDIELTGTLLNGLPPARAVKTINTSRSSTTTPTADPELTVSIPAAGVYLIEGLLVAGGGTGATTLGGTIGFTGTFDDTVLPFVTSYDTSGTKVDQIAFNTSAYQLLNSPLGATYYQGYFRGMLRATSAGTLSFNWAQYISSTSTTVLRAGSYLQATRIS